MQVAVGNAHVGRAHALGPDLERAAVSIRRPVQAHPYLFEGCNRGGGLGDPCLDNTRDGRRRQQGQQQRACERNG